MKKPYTISINAVSGGGKTALATLLAASLPRAMLFCFDDFDATNRYPADFYEWHKRGADPLEIDCPGMGEAVACALAQEALQYIVLDCPLGREHPRFATVVDLWVFIDTPLDVAMARRILRDYPVPTAAATVDAWQTLRTEMSHYLTKARYPYLEADKRKKSCDLVLDGWQDLALLRDQLLSHIQ